MTHDVSTQFFFACLCWQLLGVLFYCFLAWILTKGASWRRLGVRKYQVFYLWAGLLYSILVAIWSASEVDPLKPLVWEDALNGFTVGLASLAAATTCVAWYLGSKGVELLRERRKRH